MPADDITPFDSYARRLEGETKEAAEHKAKTDAERAAEPETPFDSYTGRLDSQLRKAQGEPQEESEPEAVEPGDEREQPTGPVGQGDYVVKQGDCISSIANETGHFWQTIWDDPHNAELREIRQDPNVLLPGDRVHFPPLGKKQEPGQTEQRHRFHRLGEPSELHMRFLEEGEPLAGEPYVLEIDGDTYPGTLDPQGRLRHPISPCAKRAVIRIGEKDPREYDIDLGEMDPCDTVSGLQRRLQNLGYDPGRIDGELDDATRSAIRRFQIAQKLPATGEPDEATREALKRYHES